jgi:hypothetical protein
VEKSIHKLHKSFKDPINQRLNKGRLNSIAMQQNITLSPDFPASKRRGPVLEDELVPFLPNVPSDTRK